MNPEPNPLTADEELLLLYWTGELDPADKDRAEAILASDPAARRHLRELQALEGTAADLPVFPRRGYTADKVIPAVVAMPASQRSSRNGMSALLWMPTAVCLGFAAAMLLLLMVPTHQVAPPADLVAPHTLLTDQLVEAPPTVSAIMNKPKFLAQRSSDFRNRRRHLHRPPSTYLPHLPVAYP